VSAADIADPGLGVWVPGPEELQRSRLVAFAESVGCESIPALVERADLAPQWYWSQVAAWLDLDWQSHPTEVADQIEHGHLTRWFPGAALNIADNAVDRWVRRGRALEPALRWELEDGSQGSWSFADLAQHVDALCHGLSGLGVRAGDRVGLQLPMTRESAVALLACAKMGAICVPVFSGYGGAAVAERLEFAGARVHIVADAFPRRGRTVDVRGSLAGELGRVDSLVHTVVVSYVEAADGEEALTFPGEVAWAELVGRHHGKPYEAFRCPTDHPLMIAFTSGSTGKPKGIVLGHSGFAIKAGSDAAFSFDLGPGDTAAWITDPGWIMSPIVLLGGLIAGSAVALYAGTPDWPDERRIWTFAEAAHVTMLGVSPTLVRLLMSKPDGRPVGSGSLRVLASSGEPWTPDAYRWLFADAFGGRLPVINYSGGTEVSGAILSNTTAQEIHPCGFAGPMPGMGADIVDDAGSSLVKGVGELALRHSSPGMPLTFWRDDERYRQTYWQRWEGLWHHGDWVERTEDGVWFIRGRSDDTLKIAGKRVGPSEVESVVNASPGVVESAAIGIPHPVKGDALVVFARCRENDLDDAGLRTLIADGVATALGRALRPTEVHLVSALPRTRSGKILRRVIRAAYLGEPHGDVSALDDPSAVSVIEAVR
jgi:acetyl-CoA synthetase